MSELTESSLNEMALEISKLRDVFINLNEGFDVVAFLFEVSNTVHEFAIEIGKQKEKYAKLAEKYDEVHDKALGLRYERDRLKLVIESLTKEHEEVCKSEAELRALINSFNGKVGANEFQSKIRFLSERINELESERDDADRRAGAAERKIAEWELSRRDLTLKRMEENSEDYIDIPKGAEI